MTIELEKGFALREKVQEGVNTLADFVSATLGPKGQNVLIHKKDSRPFVTKDGVTVAQNISFEDPFMNAGAEVVRQAAALTNSEAGDGTTTSTILAREILNQANKHISSGVPPIEIKRGLEQCFSAAEQIIADLARPLSSSEDIKHVASISANNDPVIGELVTTAVQRVGKNGSITIEEARSHDTTLELVEGFQFDSGYAAQAFVTDPRRGVARYENPLFFISDFKVDQVADILPSLEIAAREGRPFIIVSDEIDGQALAALIMNTVRGSMKVAAVKPPRYGEERRAILSDLSVSTGAKFFQQGLGHKMADVRLTDFGSAKTVEISKNQTIVVGGQGNPEKIEERIETIKREVHEEQDNHTALRLQERVTRLSSGVAIIKVGGDSEVEMIERKHRIEDALEAVNSARLEGVVPGGGTTLLKVSEKLAINFENPDQAAALQIFKNALRAPFKKMSLNAGLPPDVSLLRVQNSNNFEGINFLTGDIEDLLEAGIIDPAKVTRCALKNAVSVSSTLLLTNHGVVHS